MKKIYSLLIAILIISTAQYPSWSIDGAPQFKINVVASAVDYINGGITVTYPDGTFSVTPQVVVSVIFKNATYSDAQVYSAVVTVHSSTSITIYVNKITTGNITQAATDDITVHIFSFGPGV